MPYVEMMLIDPLAIGFIHDDLGFPHSWLLPLPGRLRSNLRTAAASWGSMPCSAARRLT